MTSSDLEPTKWADVIGYEGFYRISDTGIVVSLVKSRRGGYKPRDNPKVMNQYDNGTGYMIVGLMKNGKSLSHYVSRLMLLSFVGPHKLKKCAAHLNGIKKDNRLDNLLWTTHLENNRHKFLHGTMAHGSSSAVSILDENKVVEILKLIKQKVMLKDIAKIYAVDITTIGAISRNITWKHVPRIL